MSRELTYRKLAGVSFMDFGSTREAMGHSQVSGGRLYAAIHRGSPLMPKSLKQSDEYEGIGSVSMPIDTFIIPAMN